MKAAQLTTAASSAKNNIPIFNKESEQGFFRSSLIEHPFFSRSIHRHSDIQAKLTVNAPGDIYEKEADTIADKVVQRLCEQPAVQAKSFASQNMISPFVQMKCAHCEEEEKKERKQLIQKKPVLERNAMHDNDSFRGENSAMAIQRKCAECEKEDKLQKKSEVSGLTAPLNIEAGLQSSKGSGFALPATTRAQMEDSFGADFSDVRIHNDHSSVQMNRNLHAHAFTHGSDVYFNSGKYDTHSVAGKRLLAHELTHTIQQGTVNKTAVQRDLLDDATGYYNAVKDTGKAIYQQGANIVSSVSDTILDTGTALYQQGAAIVSPIEDKAKNVVDWAKQTANKAIDTAIDTGIDLSELAIKKANAVAQINFALQKISRSDAVFFTDDQLDAINSHIESVSKKSHGLIRLPSVAATNGPVGISGSKPVAASTLEDLLKGMRASIQAEFMSGDAASNTKDTANVQGSIQRFALLGVLAGLSLLEILAIIAIFLIIVLLLLSGPKVIEKEKENIEEKEREEQRKKEEKEKEEEEERKRKEEEERQKKENDKKIGLPCIDVEVLKGLNNIQGNLLINNLYSDNWVFFRKNVNEDRGGKGTYCTDKAAIANDKRDFFLKIDKTFQHCLVMVCSPLGKIIAFSPGIKHASLTGGDVHAELNALPFIKAQLLRNPKDTIGAKLFSVCFDFACDKSETSCVPQLQKFVNENLPGGSFESNKSRDRNNMKDVCDNAFDDALKSACAPPG